MESDDLAPHIPRKCSRSPSVASVASTTRTSTSLSAPTASSEGARPPAPKRLRRSHDVPAYDAPVEEHARRAMASANPLGRRVLKREAKKARRAATRALGRPLGGGMDVDDVGLGATFMDADDVSGGCMGRFCVYDAMLGVSRLGTSERVAVLATAVSPVRDAFVLYPDDFPPQSTGRMCRSGATSRRRLGT